jgi:hypothetical protein
VLTCFTALRIEDVEGMKERMVTVKLANKTQPRRIIIVLDKTKNFRAALHLPPRHGRGGDGRVREAVQGRAQDALP